MNPTGLTSVSRSSEGGVTDSGGAAGAGRELERCGRVRGHAEAFECFDEPHQTRVVGAGLFDDLADQGAHRARLRTTELGHERHDAARARRTVWRVSCGNTMIPAPSIETRKPGARNSCCSRSIIASSFAMLPTSRGALRALSPGSSLAPEGCEDHRAPRHACLGRLRAPCEHGGSASVPICREATRPHAPNGVPAAPQP